MDDDAQGGAGGSGLGRKPSLEWTEFRGDSHKEWRSDSVGNADHLRREQGERRAETRLTATHGEDEDKRLPQNAKVTAARCKRKALKIAKVSCAR